MTRLVAIDLPAGLGFVAAVADTWDAGDAVFPLDQRLPLAERTRVLAAVRPTHVLGVDGTSVWEGGVVAEPGDAVVIATSGTTGAPKAAVLTIDAIEAATAMTGDALDIGDADRWLLCLPPAHIGGFGVVARALCGGVGLDAHDGFEADAVEAAAREGATLVSLVPAVLNRIDPALFRVILLGGSAMPTERPANTVATYGMTETAGGIVYDGRPLDGVEVKIDDSGQVLVKSPTLLRAYRVGPAPFDADGFLPTGDLGTFDGDVLRIEGRMDDVIVTGGQKVWPERVEAVLGRHADVDDVRVVGRPDPTWGQVVVAQIVSSTPPSLDTMAGMVRDELPPYMAPRAVELVDFIERTALGKIRRPRLDSPPRP